MNQILFSSFFSGHNLRLAFFVYRLIGATLIGKFFDVPFLNRIEISVKGGHLCPPGR